MNEFRAVTCAYACDVLAAACKSHAVKSMLDGDWKNLCNASLFNEQVRVEESENYIQIVSMQSGYRIAYFKPCAENLNWWLNIPIIWD